VMMISTAASGPENLAVTSMMLRIPVPDTALDLAEKVETSQFCVWGWPLLSTIVRGG